MTTVATGARLAALQRPRSVGTGGWAGPCVFGGIAAFWR